MRQSRFDIPQGVTKIQWSEKPGQSDGKWVQVLTPKSGQKLEMIVLSREVQGVETHFVQDRTTPCFGLPSCELCKHHFPKRWKGYVIGLLGTGQMIAAELSTYAVRRCPELMDKEVCLRGEKLTVRRAAGKPNNPLRAEFLEHAPDMGFKVERLPEIEDIKTILWRLWTGGR